MSGRFATATPHRIKAAHRRRRKVASGQSVQRYYDPAIGRFLSVDPVAADTVTGWNFNRYNYAANNPYKFKDPDGRIIDTVIDVGFIIADVVDIASNGLNAENGASLAGNIAGALIPGATGLGKIAATGVIAIKAADKAADARKGAVASKKAATAKVGDRVETPDSNPEKFTNLGGGQGVRNNKTNEIWQKSHTNHSGDKVGEFKVGVGGKPPTPSKKITVTRSNCTVSKRDGC